MRSADTIEGELLDARFRGGRILGRGRSCVVHEAVDLVTQAPVAVKVVRDEYADDPFAHESLRREAKRLQGLRHPNVVSVVHSGFFSGRPYVAMELIRGKSVAKRLSGGKRVEFSEFVPIAAQILKAIGFAHSRSTVVRDIKPSNIMLSERKGRSNYVTLLDFGLARTLDTPSRLKGPRTLGTPGYLAPELISGDDADTRADVYSLGVLFWRMLVGSLPFGGSDEETILDRTLHAELPSLRSALGDETDVPPPVITLLERCIQRAPEDRPHDANIVVEALIDAVPARRFRLPRVSRATATTGVEERNTGLVALTRDQEAKKHREAAALELQQRQSPEVHPRSPEQRGLLMAYGVGAVLAGALAVFATARQTKPPALAAVGIAVQPPSPALSISDPELHDATDTQPEQRTEVRHIERGAETAQSLEEEGADAQAPESEGASPPVRKPRNRRRRLNSAEEVPEPPKTPAQPGTSTALDITTESEGQRPTSRLVVERRRSAVVISNEGLMVRN